MAWYWNCNYERGSGVDYDSCGAVCRRPFTGDDAEIRARKAADAHATRTGHHVSVWERKRGWKKEAEKRAARNRRYMAKIRRGSKR